MGGAWNVGVTKGDEAWEVEEEEGEGKVIVRASAVKEHDSLEHLIENIEP